MSLAPEVAVGLQLKTNQPIGRQCEFESRHQYLLRLMDHISKINENVDLDVTFLKAIKVEGDFKGRPPHRIPKKHKHKFLIKPFGLNVRYRYRQLLSVGRQSHDDCTNQNKIITKKFDFINLLLKVEIWSVSRNLVHYGI